MKIGVANTSASPMYLAGVMIPAGETRHFDAAELPPELHPQVPEAEAPTPDADILGALLKFSVAEIVTRFELLPDDVLAELVEREGASAKPRKSLLAALAEEQLQRAADRTDPDPAREGEEKAGEGA